MKQSINMHSVQQNINNALWSGQIDFKCEIKVF